MIVTVASGKGGTGKTSVAAALLRLWTQRVVAVDLDVEAPNLHLFLSPEWRGATPASLVVPEVVAPDACTGCGACSDICAFKAILNFGDFPVVFQEMCHGCEGCLAVCQTGALGKGTRHLGDTHWGQATLPLQTIPFVMGDLRVGEAMSPPLMKSVLRSLSSICDEMNFPMEGADVVIDAPPGASCPAMEAVQPADVILLVAEPTPFGLHDLIMAWQAFSGLGKPVAVIINRYNGGGVEGNQLLEKWCAEHGLPVVARLPYSRMAAEAYARQEAIDTLKGDYIAQLKEVPNMLHSLSQGESCYVL